MKPVEEVTIVIPSEGHVVRKHLVNKGKLVLWFHLVDLRYKSQSSNHLATNAYSEER